MGCVKQKSGQERCKLTSSNIILNFSRKEECLENDFWLINEYRFISGNYLTFSPFFGIMSEFILGLNFLVRVLIIICFLPIHLINLEGFSISMLILSIIKFLEAFLFNMNQL